MSNKDTSFGQFLRLFLVLRIAEFVFAVFLLSILFTFRGDRYNTMHNDFPGYITNALGAAAIYDVGFLYVFVSLLTLSIVWAVFGLRSWPIAVITAATYAVHSVVLMRGLGMGLDPIDFVWAAIVCFDLALPFIPRVRESLMLQTAR